MQPVWGRPSLLGRHLQRVSAEGEKFRLSHLQRELGVGQSAHFLSFGALDPGGCTAGPAAA